jgi:lipopolysaccharide transport system permease protein
MFVTPVIYPLSSVKENVRWIVLLNPLTSLFEFSRFCLLGEGNVSLQHLLITVLFSSAVFVFALIIFNRQGNKLMDIV